MHYRLSQLPYSTIASSSNYNACSLNIIIVQSKSREVVTSYYCIVMSSSKDELLTVQIIACLTMWITLNFLYSVIQLSNMNIDIIHKLHFHIH